MAGKASKIALEKMEQDLIRNVETKIKEMKFFVNTNSANLTQEMKQINDFAQSLEENVTMTIEKKFKREKLRMGV